MVRARQTAFAIAVVLLAGCSKDRPDNVALRPGDCYTVLSNLKAEVVGSDLRMKVHYHFPDRVPHPDHWFAFSFQVQAGATSTVTIRKQGRELGEGGDITASTKTSLAGQRGGVVVKVRQSPTADGEFADVSGEVSVAF